MSALADQMSAKAVFVSCIHCTHLRDPVNHRLDALAHAVYTQHMDMHSTGFVISQTDGRPMYLQIIEQIKHRIAVGDWARGEEIPSIRQLAVALQVSVITVKRAYLELEREGVIVTRHGKGSTVAADPLLSPRLYEQDLAQHLEEAARIGALLTIEEEDLVARLRTTIQAANSSRAANRSTEEDL